MNISNRISKWSLTHPNKKAVIFPVRKKDEYTYQSLTFKELEDKSTIFASQLRSLGVVKGHKVLVFLKPSIDFHAVAFSLFKLGAIPVFIDPGMGMKNLLKSIKQVKPDVLMAEPIVHLVKFFSRSAFKTIKLSITTSRFGFGCHATMNQIKIPNQKIDFTVESLSPSDTAAILFTSGGTGIPKGVVYTHDIFWKQTDMLQKMYSLTEDDVDLPGFPLFSFFTMSMGMTSCTPDLDPSKPAKCSPERIVKNIQDNQTSFVAGSPAIWEKVANYCLSQKIKLPTVKYVVMFGAPVSIELHEKFQVILPNGDSYAPYGATESLPISNNKGSELILNTKIENLNGKGTCVGKPVDGMKVKIIPIEERVIENISQTKFLAPNQIGEIIVNGDVVTSEYYDMPKKTAEAKIHSNEGIWHRMGDIGYLDESGNIWFCGRKSHRVEIEGQLLSSVQCEAVFNRHPMVRRSALIGIGHKSVTPGIVVELKDHKIPGGKNRVELTRELLNMGSKYEHTKGIKKVFFKENFPVDVRHNIKIDRLKLRDEITKRLQ